MVLIPLAVLPARGEATSNTWHFVNAPLTLVLKDFGRMHKATLLYSPRVSKRQTLSLEASGTSKALGLALVQALEEKDLQLQPAAGKFLLVLPKGHEPSPAALKAFAGKRLGEEQAKPQASTPFTMMFAGAPVDQLFDVYRTLTGQTVQYPKAMTRIRVDLKGQTLLTRAEATVGIELFLRLYQVELKVAGDGSTVAVRDPARPWPKSPALPESNQRRLCMLTRKVDGALHAAFCDALSPGAANGILLQQGQTNRTASLSLTGLNLENQMAEIQVGTNQWTVGFSDVFEVPVQPNQPRLTKTPVKQLPKGLTIRPRGAQTGEALKKHLQDYNMEIIRKGLPPLPIPLTPEQDRQLVEEGILPLAPKAKPRP
jgi:hypothetical protein